MDKGIVVKLQLKDAQMVELYRVYDQLHEHFGVNSPHDLLLKGHAKEMRDRLRAQVDKCQGKYTFSLTAVDACAFVQTWENAMKPLPHYTAQLIQSIFNQLDHSVKNRRVLR
jgi:hypothetical protein